MRSFTPDQVRLGFIGVGAMGSRLIRRLLDHHCQVIVYDQDCNRAAELASSDAFVAGSLTELAENADVIMMNKDFRLILETAKSSNLTLPATAAAYEVNSAAFREDPDSDLSSVIRYMETLLDLNISQGEFKTRAERQQEPQFESCD